MQAQSNYYEFLVQPKETQAGLVWKYGTFLERVVKDGKPFWLYSMYGFYVEMEMSPDEENVEDVRAFMNAKHLEKYLDNIDLEGLLAA